MTHAFRLAARTLLRLSTTTPAPKKRHAPYWWWAIQAVASPAQPAGLPKRTAAQAGGGGRAEIRRPLLRRGATRAEFASLILEDVLAQNPPASGKADSYTTYLNTTQHHPTRLEDALKIDSENDLAILQPLALQMAIQIIVYIKFRLIFNKI